MYGISRGVDGILLKKTCYGDMRYQSQFSIRYKGHYCLSVITTPCNMTKMLALIMKSHNSLGMKFLTILYQIVNSF